jgi:hypothetical protein
MNDDIQLPCTIVFTSLGFKVICIMISNGEFNTHFPSLHPGLHILGFDLCECCISMRTISTRIQQNMVVCETKTEDNVFVHITVAVQQQIQIENAKDAIYK